jgi:transcriptional regulator GlxA family with amidase domain
MDALNHRPVPEQRVKKAKHLLTNYSLLIGDISTEVGCDLSANFTHFFK